VGGGHVPPGPLPPLLPPSSTHMMDVLCGFCSRKLKLESHRLIAKTNQNAMYCMINFRSFPRVIPSDRHPVVPQPQPPKWKAVNRGKDGIGKGGKERKKWDWKIWKDRICSIDKILDTPLRLWALPSRTNSEEWQLRAQCSKSGRPLKCYSKMPVFWFCFKGACLCTLPWRLAVCEAALLRMLSVAVRSRFSLIKYT